jgi:hypothetical protein
LAFLEWSMKREAMKRKEEETPSSATTFAVSLKGV